MGAQPAPPDELPPAERCGDRDRHFGVGSTTLGAMRAGARREVRAERLPPYPEGWGHRSRAPSPDMFVETIDGGHEA